MREMTKHGQLGVAAVRAGMDRKTARKYVRTGKLPSELEAPRTWRTRPDPFEQEWDDVVALLRESPGLEAKTLFQVLREKHPGKYAPGQLRTLQRHVRRWRAQSGPEQEVMLAQAHVPGEAAQTDFTEATSLRITIAGVLFAHLLCVFVLPYSNWNWATVCLSESLAALRKGVQAALFQLGRVPRFHQTDNSTAATHRIPKGKGQAVAGRKRPFNDDYLALMRHFGMEPRTTKIGAKEQNGDVEASNGALKRRLEQALLLRGSRDFDSTQSWMDFVHEVLRKANAERGPRFTEDMAAMQPLRAKRLPEFVEEQARVCEWSTLRVQHCAYSVPSRLIGEVVRVRLFEERVEVYFQGVLQLSCERLRGGNHRHRIDYRHVVWSLVRKPGAFARYVYREELFPSVVFRRAYDAIQTPHSGMKGDLEYLRVLHLAASTLESDVEAALGLLLTSGKSVTADAVKALVAANTAIQVPVLAAPMVNLVEYDGLLSGVGT
jgi:hypothetical protein